MIAKQGRVIAVCHNPGIRSVFWQEVTKPHGRATTCLPRTKGMAGEASHSDNTRDINWQVEGDRDSGEAYSTVGSLGVFKGVMP